MRCFIAITPDENLLRAVKKLQRELSQNIPDGVVRWVMTPQMHLTLKFLGEVEDNNLDALKAALQLACTQTKPFTLKLQGAGAFPSLRRINVIWIGIGGEVGVLKELQTRVDSHTQAYSTHEEKRPFSAHLTIARIKPCKPATVERMRSAIQATQAVEIGEWKVERVELIRSELSPHGSRYTTLFAVSL